ncbi:MAG: hypothetical protein ACI4FZ_04515 [Lachnospiraceae bacterium]
MEAVFRAPTPYMWAHISKPAYAEPNNEGIELAENRKRIVRVGDIIFRYWFSEGKNYDEITLTGAGDILRMREYIKVYTGFVEVSCDKEAEMLGGGVEEPVGDDRHAKHKEELMRKYGEDEEQDYSEWDRKLSKLLR